MVIERNKRKVRDHVWMKIKRDHALVNQLGNCIYCKSRLKRNEATADHIVPRSKNGSNDQDNIAAACEPCNKAKGSMSKKLFNSILQGRKKPRTLQQQFRGIVYRLNKRTDFAVRNILRAVGK